MNTLVKLLITGTASLLGGIVLGRVTKRDKKDDNDSDGKKGK